jgi:UDP-N-acetyl-D-glucosamine dehydrogenase
MDTILTKLTEGQPRVAVVGMGYVGLPLALVMGEAGLHVIGMDIDTKKVESINKGASYIHHIPSERIAAMHGTGRFTATADFAQASTCDAIIICVPTPLDHHLQPDLTFIEATCRHLAPHLRAETLVILESTTWPGTTAEVVTPLLTQGSGLEAGTSLFIAYSPEREDPGNPDFGTKTIPKLVGGLDERSTELAVALYRRALDQVVPVGSSQVAEAAKLFENIFRSVNIALVNEMKMILDPMGIDVWQVIQAAATKPFGFMPFWPGPGLGGHCIPIDPFYLSWKAKEFGTDTRFIELAGQINRAMPEWVIRKAQDCLNDHSKPLKGSRILILGMAYKNDVDDMRESPSLVLMELLEQRGATVEYHDPWIPVIPSTREHAAYTGRTSTAPTDDFDCFILATAHSGFSPEQLLAYGVPIIDTRNLFPPHPLVTKA